MPYAIRSSSCSRFATIVSSRSIFELTGSEADHSAGETLRETELTLQQAVEKPLSPASSRATNLRTKLRTVLGA
jgi:hypothetical protein